MLVVSESWFSVTPEKIAEHIAERCQCDLMIMMCWMFGSPGFLSAASVI